MQSSRKNRFSGVGGTGPLDVRFMRIALREARKGLGRTSPNPAVGAVIVRDGKIVATGYHRKAGLPHAEIEALSKVGGRAPGDTLYVTMEPCNHQGRTPPCTAAILRSGIRRVVVGAMDPNPNVIGGGCDYLVANGLDVTTGVLEEDCRRLNEDFNAFVTTGRPFVTLKSAMTLDGWTATATGSSRWVTGEASRAFVHRLRDRVDAVMVGVGTVLADDPELTTRLERNKGKDPLRIVLDAHLKTPPESRILNQDSDAETWLAASEALRGQVPAALERKGVAVHHFPSADGLIDLPALLDWLGSKMVTSILVEGGSRVAGSLIRQRLVNKFYLFKAPKLLAGDDGIPMVAGPGFQDMAACLVLRDIDVQRFGDDIMVAGYPDYR